MLLSSTHIVRSIVACLFTAALVRAQVDQVEYAVIAFPQHGQSVAVSVDGRAYTLSPSDLHPNLYKGKAPFASTYRYAMVQNETPHYETYERHLNTGAQDTGNEFFNRSRTLHDVPSLPQAYHPIYPTLFSSMNQSDQVATLILQANSSAIQDILTNPIGDHPYAAVFDLAYISQREVYTFKGAGIKNSGKSTKDFAKQSYKIQLNKYADKNTSDRKQLLFGRSTIKLRAHETDPTFIREKLVMDMLGASGAATLSGQFVRVYINNEPFGLYLLIDDATTSFIDNVLHGGDYTYRYTGPTYKGNAMNPQEEGNLVYLGENASLYHSAIYELEDKGADSKALDKTNEMQPLIEFTRRLSEVDPRQATDAQNQGTLSNLIDERHTLLHLAINFLTGSWDGVWHQASNYYLNMNTQSTKWTLISYDFDETLGIGAPDYFVSTPYTNFSRPDSKRPLVDALLQSPYWCSEFEIILQTLVKRFFKQSVIGPRVAAWQAMLRQDVEWDLSLTPKSPGIKTSWTLWNYEHNMNATDGANLGVTEWVERRSQAVQQQLGFNDVDDLPPLGPYLDAKQWNPVDYETKRPTTNGANGIVVTWAGAALTLFAVILLR